MVETCTRGCQNISFTDTQDILNILIGRLTGDEQNEEPVFLCDEEFSGEGLTNDEWKSHLFS